MDRNVRLRTPGSLGVLHLMTVAALRSPEPGVGSSLRLTMGARLAPPSHRSSPPGTRRSLWPGPSARRRRLSVFDWLPLPFVSACLSKNAATQADPSPRARAGPLALDARPLCEDRRCPRLGNELGTKARCDAPRLHTAQPPALGIRMPGPGVDSTGIHAASADPPTTYVIGRRRTTSGHRAAHGGGGVGRADACEEPSRTTRGPSWRGRSPAGAAGARRARPERARDVGGYL
jgi:hypothetical protein